jgi:hypothetical protein
VVVVPGVDTVVGVVLTALDEVGAESVVGFVVWGF